MAVYNHSVKVPVKVIGIEKLKAIINTILTSFDYTLIEDGEFFQNFSFNDSSASENTITFNIDAYNNSVEISCYTYSIEDNVLEYRIVQITTELNNEVQKHLNYHHLENKQNQQKDFFETTKKDRHTKKSNEHPASLAKQIQAPKDNNIFGVLLLCIVAILVVLVLINSYTGGNQNIEPSYNTAPTHNTAKKVSPINKTEMMTCTQCGREFEKMNGFVLNNRPGYFCSQSCARDYVDEHGGFTTDY